MASLDNISTRVRILINFSKLIVDRFNNETKYQAIPEKYGANKGKKIGILFTDANKLFVFQFANGKLKWHVLSSDHDVLAKLTLDTLLNVADKRMKRLDLATNKEVFLPYSLQDAFRYGDIETEGEASTNDVRLLIEVFTENIDILQNLLDGIKRC